MTTNGNEIAGEFRHARNLCERSRKLQHDIVHGRVARKHFDAIVAALDTLHAMGYTHEGGSLWKPPLGVPPKFANFIAHESPLPAGVLAAFVSQGHVVGSVVVDGEFCMLREHWGIFGHPAWPGGIEAWPHNTAAGAVDFLRRNPHPDAWIMRTLSGGRVEYRGDALANLIAEHPPA